MNVRVPRITHSVMFAVKFSYSEFVRETKKLFIQHVFCSPVSTEKPRQMLVKLIFGILKILKPFEPLINVCIIYAEKDC